MSKNKKYLPTSYFFNQQKWLKQEKDSDKSYREAGLIIGNTLLKIDKQFQSLLSKNGSISGLEIIIFMNNYTVYILDQFKNNSESYTTIIEALCDGSQLLLRNSNNDYKGMKGYDFYTAALQLATKRVYLVEKWNKVTKGMLKLSNKNGEILFESINKDLDFGEIIAVSRFQDHLNQLQFKAKNNVEIIDPRVSGVPTKFAINNKELEIAFKQADRLTMLELYILNCQIPFYYKKLIKINFKNHSTVTLLDLSLFWLVFRNLAKCVISYFEIETTEAKHWSFSQNSLVEILCKCTYLNAEKAQQLISLFTNNLKQISETAVDLYIKPLYETNEGIQLCLPTLITGQFTRIVDYIVNTEINPLIENEKHFKKGKLFEEDFAELLTDQIKSNQFLDSNKCKVLAVNFKRKPRKNNEEIDIVVRVGETYLIIEAKSFVYRAGTIGYHNNYNELIDSDLNQKKQFFIEDYSIFKSKYDPEADFIFNENKVLCCYLSSVPHCVGLNIGGYPVVDSSILERYFGNANFQIFNSNRTHKTFWFYKNLKQAELNLFKYLNTPPQLMYYKDSFSYVLRNFDEGYEGKNIVFSEPFFDPNILLSEQYAKEIFKLADTWCLEFPPED